MNSPDSVKSNTLLDSDYHNVEHLLGDKATNLSPEVKEIIAQAFAIIRKRSEINHTSQKYLSQ